MDDYHTYEALEESVKMEDVTDDEINANILRRLSVNDTDFEYLYLRHVAERVRDATAFCPTTAKEMGWLGHFVGKSNQLKRMRIKNYNLRDWNGLIKPFCKGLSRNKFIEWIDFGGVDLSGGEIFGMMRPFFETNSSLVALYGCNLGMSSKGIEALSAVLQNPNSKLERLYMEDNLIGNEEAKILATSLAGNRTLKSLHFEGSNTTITDEAWTEFSNLLCDTSSVNKTFMSNHTLAHVYADSQNDNSDVFRSDVKPYLSYNRHDDKVAMIKIARTHGVINMQPFFEWGLKVLPYAVRWFDDAISIPIANQMPATLQQRKLSAIYQFIRGFPLLYIEGGLKQELKEIPSSMAEVQHNVMMLANKLRVLTKRKEEMLEREKSVMKRLKGF